MVRFFPVCFIIILVLSGCCGVHTVHPYYEALHAKRLSRVTYALATRYEHDYHLRFEDAQAIYDDNDQFEKFYLEFTTQKLLTIDDGRRILVGIVESFLERINEDIFLANDLEHYPITPEDLSIAIYPESFYGKYIDEKYLGWIVLKKGIAYYYAFDTKNNRRSFWNSRIEYYSQSKEAVEFKRNGEIEYLETLPPPPRSELAKDQYKPVDIDKNE